MYISTRGDKARLVSAAAIKAGIAADGGLFVPEILPQFTYDELTALAELDYQGRAFAVLSRFLPDYTTDELKECVAEAYSQEKFDHPAVAPLVAVGEGEFVLELWHGPTSAFKDMALQLLPQLLSKALKKTNETAEIVILVATSGDTGKAALEGFKDVPQTRIIVFFPREGVSQIQRLQMITQQGRNVSVIAVGGNFDDAQTGVKNIFNDPSFNAGLAAEGFRLSSANSINWGRLVPQIVYYISAYCDMLKSGSIQPKQAVNFVVPTGNFGNILAGYYAKMIGLPINRLICASNSNNVLTDFLQSGIYDRQREFHKTISPSMDILISSNLERLLYHITNGDCSKVNNWMAELAANGVYNIGEEYLKLVHSLFWAGWADDAATMQTIKEVYDSRRYVLDPHTAVAWRVGADYRQQTGDMTPQIIVSTASSFKFNESVLAALSGEGSLQGKDEFALLRELSQISGQLAPAGLSALENSSVLHTTVCEKQEMPEVVKNILGG